MTEEFCLNIRRAYMVALSMAYLEERWFCIKSKYERFEVFPSPKYAYSPSRNYYVGGDF